MVVDEAVKISLVTEQLRVPGAAMLALGAVVFWVTVVEAETVQPLPGSVAVTP